MKYVCAIAVLFTVMTGPVLARPGHHYNMGPVHRFSPVPTEEANLVTFANGWVIDTQQGEPNLPEDLCIEANSADELYHIVQFTGPIDQQWFRTLASAGIRSFGYLPQYAVLAQLNAGQREFVAGLPFVNWVGLFQPVYKLELDLLGKTGVRRFSVVLMPDADATAATRLVEDCGGEVLLVDTSCPSTTMEVVLDTRHIPELARLNDVLWIQAWSEPTTCNNSAQWVVQAGWLATAPPDTSLTARKVWANGVRGQGVILSVHDTGLNTGHNMFKDPALSITPPGIWPTHRKVVAYKRYGTADASEGQYHGSHVNGTVAGNDSVMGGTSYYDGMAKDARLYFVDLTNGTSFVVSSNLYTVWDTVHAGRGLPDSLRPIWQASGSWRYSNSQGTYLLQDASTDQFGWEHKDFLNIFAAGNEGSTARTVGNPSLAKSVLTIGADSNGTKSNKIASFSSRGPSQDNRYKPNIMATGVNLYSAQAAPSTNGYSSMSGTSMATPTANGAVGLMRCYLQEGFYPTGVSEPGNRLVYNSAALLRSMAIASADPNVGSYTVPDYNIGWGRVNAESVLYFAGDLRELLLCDDTFGLATGEYKEQTFRVASSIPLRVCLAWTDTAAAPNANPTLVNDLNLELTSPGGTKYRGNQYTSGQSTPNPTSWDNRNVEECCRVNSPDTGLWTIRVYGQNVRTAQKQWFAWTITGDLSTQVVPGKDVGVRTIVRPVGQVDSGSVVVPSAEIENYGSTDETVLTEFRIGTDYTDTLTVLVLAGQRSTVSYKAWTAGTVGTFPVRCSTALAGDTFPANNFLVDTVTVVPLSGIAGPSELPRVYSLANPVPNPVKWTARIRFGLPRPGHVRVSVYSVLGTLIETLADEPLPAGYHELVWDVCQVPGGIYLLRLEAGDYTATRKFVLDR